MGSDHESALRLTPGSRIAVIGGGPAGSFFALASLDLAAQRNLPLEITVFERKDLTATGPQGCNMCAGIVSHRVVQGLARLQVELEPRIIAGRVDAYRLHWHTRSVLIHPPDPSRVVLSVYRAGGPRHSPFAPANGLDHFMLEQARTRGARVIPERVLRVQFGERPVVVTNNRREVYDLVVLAGGVNASPPEFQGLEYRPPATETMAQDELLIESEQGRSNLRGVVHVYFDQPVNLTFGALIPKGQFANVSLLGHRLGRASIDEFLAASEVARMVGDRPRQTCGCRPRVAVSPARAYYADRFVAVGDSCVTRLYKDGIGSALATARAAAETALLHGIGAADFGAYYVPVCRSIDADNRAGRVVFGIVAFSKQSRVFIRALGRALELEAAEPPASRMLGTTLWALFTGDSTYTEILRLLFRPKSVARLARGAVSLFGRH